MYKEKQINLHNMESVHTRILTNWVHSTEYISFPLLGGDPQPQNIPPKDEFMTPFLSGRVSNLSFGL